jgi:7-carboxy-7-deazaguanine synthase (Cx14CxxC type)
MTYAVKEMFYTLQGEGMRAGRAAVFCRFAGCNLWSGREADRAGAVCTFCDTQFVGTDGMGGGKFETADLLAAAVGAMWPSTGGGKPYVVFTGGEPLLQLDPALIEAMHAIGFEIAVETNGTIAAPDGIDWICVSPKSDAPLAQVTGHELKLVYPQQGVEPARFLELDFQHFMLQPLWGSHTQRNMELAARYCMDHPRWRLSVQTHKWIGIP